MFLKGYVNYCEIKGRRFPVSEYVFSWKMTRRLAKKLVWQQFKHYYLLKYFFKYFLGGESLLAIMILINFHSPVFFVIATLLWLGMTFLILYEFFYYRMIPKRPYVAEYYSYFNDTGFGVDGKTYRRPYTYDQIDRLIVKKDCLIFVTGYEGMILPMTVFLNKNEKEKFLHDLHIILKNQRE